jgi:hypothetical protein
MTASVRRSSMLGDLRGKEAHGAIIDKIFRESWRVEEPDLPSPLDAL